METEDHWRIILNEGDGQQTRLIFSIHNPRYLIDVTVDSYNANRIVQAVTDHHWTYQRLMSFLNAEAANAS